MTVYIVTYSVKKVHNVLWGVFSSQEKAEQALRDIMKDGSLPEGYEITSQVVE